MQAAEKKKDKRKSRRKKLSFQKHWFLRVIYQRLLVVVLIVIQLIMFISLTLWVSDISHFVNLFLRIFSWAVVLLILASERLAVYKLSWIILVLSFPIVGAPLYVILSLNLFSGKLFKRLQKSLEVIEPLRRIRPEVHEALNRHNRTQYSLSRFIAKTGAYPLYTGGEAHYLAQGEEMFAHMMAAIEKAENYIFLEYFIVENDSMLQDLLLLLEDKAAEGVEVKFLYDDMGSLFRLPNDFPQMLERMGISCRRFNHLVPILSTQFNNRDHRKMTVIDGRVAYTGGINLADEYINKKVRFGHWKDGGAVFTGEAAWGMSLMFMELWTAAEEAWPPTKAEILRYCPDPAYLDFEAPLSEEEKASDAFTQHFGDSPFDNIYTGRHVYKLLTFTAVDYLYIMTPYLVLDYEMVQAICMAAQRGVDVRIITPHIWDKAYVKVVSRSFYKEFIEAGVKIYEYTPGFIHTKSLVTDDQTCVIGTINFDYRSLYLHFEDAVAFYNQPCVAELKEDFLRTQALSKEITEEDFKLSLPKRIFAQLLRLFAPLM